MLLTILDAVPQGIDVEVWLPTDLAHPAHPLCDELTRRGVEVRHVDLPILRRAYRKPRALAALLGRAVRLAGTLRSAAPDVVYCTSSAALPAALSARLARVPSVLGHVQEIWSRSDALVLTGLALLCRRLVAISSAAARSLPGPLQGRTRVVPNATVDPGSPHGLAGRDGPLHFLVASRWNGWKGHRTLLRAWELAGHPGRLTVLGGPPASGDAVDVRALVAALPDPASVDVVGEVSDASPYVAAADVMIVPSERPEPFGLVAIEAFAAARPVVASDAGGPADIVADGITGWLFPPGDAAALAVLLGRLTRAQVTEAGLRAREAFDAGYTVAGYVERWQRAFAGMSWMDGADRVG
ncbi:glycosyltransferase family 4 protein [Jatrophihabitans endophyticus]|uniref:glycosyltransferase family 4 protein n=1 Tax=Jatrophihabitans endophyticus TaxID=1206085 RepID=UPI0019DACE8C|nr:glycosyltransferase family 4 protein [Jatrophihabitans endophyticus]MBE7190816.1 glycosyltransferase family 4 protein [Jatrophihabitans endophyticus]